MNNLARKYYDWWNVEKKKNSLWGIGNRTTG